MPNVSLTILFSTRAADDLAGVTRSGQRVTLLSPIGRRLDEIVRGGIGDATDIAALENGWYLLSVQNESDQEAGTSYEVRQMRKTPTRSQLETG
jgi:hypothetical protein